MSIIYNTKSKSFIKFPVQLHICKIGTPNIVYRDENTFENVSTGTQLDYK